jgi:hypothetical protein
MKEAHRMTQGGWQTWAPTPGMGRVVVDTSYPGSAFLYAATGVTIVVNGAPLRANWGPTSLDLPPGHHFVEVSSRYLGRTGVAGTWVPVSPGQTTMVFYRAPAIVFARGSIGPVPQPTRGMATTVVLMLLLVFLPFMIVLLTLH